MFISIKWVFVLYLATTISCASSKKVNRTTSNVQSTQISCESIFPKLYLDSKFVEVYGAHDLSISEANIHGKELSGNLNNGIFEAEIEGRRVLIKKLQTYKKNEVENGMYLARLARAEAEIFMYRKFSDLGLTPAFRGIYQFEDGGYGIISDLIDPSFLIRDPTFLVGRLKGKTTRQLKRALRKSDKNVKELWRQRLREIIEVLNINEYLVNDLQVLATPGGQVFLIDVGMYYKSEGTVTEENNQTLNTYLELIK